MKKYIYIIFLLYRSIIPAQENDFYGLKLNSGNYPLAKRSSLNLTSENRILIKNKFSISFDISFRNSNYLGPVLTIETDNFNARLLFNQYADKDSAQLRLMLSPGSRVLDIAVSKNELMLTKWYNIKLNLNLPDNTAGFQFNGKSRTSTLAADLLPGEANIWFGRIPNYGADTPPVNLREIKIYNDESLQHYWKLNEIDGNLAHDLINNLTAVSENPNWLLPKHFNWQKIDEIGPFPLQKKNDQSEVNILLNKQENEIWFIYKDFAYRYSLITRQTKKEIFIKPRPHLYSMEIFNPYSNKLLSLYCGRGNVSEYDYATKAWSFVDTAGEHELHYYGNNLFINPLSKDLMMMNGYGWYRMKNDLQKYNSRTKTWETLQLKGDFIPPRKDAAIIMLGDSGKFLIFGGQGNESGEQSDGYRLLKDLYIIDLQNHTAKKLWEMNDFYSELLPLSPGYYDEKTDNFYLAMVDVKSEEKFKKLYKFSIGKPGCEIVSDSVGGGDLNFNDGIFYSDITNKLYVATRGESNENGYLFELYELDFPPISYKEMQLVAYQSTKNNYYPVIIFLGFAGVFAVALLFRRNRNKKSIYSVIPLSPKISPMSVITNSIYLFGPFQVFDRAGNDITKEFSPKLKQLFLLILFHSYNGINRGISPELLSAILWPELSSEQTKNNRNVSISKLRNVLAKLDAEIINDKNQILLVLNEAINCDFVRFRNIMIEPALDTEKIQELREILVRGELLAGESYDWFDGRKTQVIEDTLTKLKEKASAGNLTQDSVSKLADSMLMLDSVSEDGMILKVKFLIETGEHNLAQKTFDLFKKEYFRLYSEDYPKTFSELLS